MAMINRHSLKNVLLILINSAHRENNARSGDICLADMYLIIETWTKYGGSQLYGNRETELTTKPQRKINQI